ncbi:Predicted metalloprotease [Amycolatopsis xylanica]|uniref:Predicted metalloprotease n=1 Tax=Amycolatopsis xylanica TaxID=589385 RepID=A0A1H3QTD5_9PSEU|nr:neutral zinc metallopeptidase [Amycolatopsis xylanica]SDZ15969.1 Predicted metalloprotease [Amycolatopsis xylanica]
MALAVVLVAGTACKDGGGGLGVSGDTPKTSPGDIAGLPVTHFESGLKQGAPKPDLQVRNNGNTPEDELAIATIADVQGYWTEKLPAEFGGQKFDPVKILVSYDSKGADQKTACGSTKGQVNAFYCPPDDSVAWDRGGLLKMLNKRFGPMSVVTVLAHEFGHAIQFRLGQKAGVGKNTPTIVKEQQADCFAGGYMRWIAEEKSKYLRLSTSDGLSSVLASMFLIRDTAGKSATEQGAHGSAFDRTYAFQTGFEKGPKECAGMNEENIKARVTEEPFVKGDKGKGDTKFTKDTVALLKSSLDEAFKGAGVPGPQIVDEGAGNCGPKSTPPATYCADNNTVSIDGEKLNILAQRIDREAEWQGEDQGGMGDFAAFAEVASRYVLGIQKGVGASLDNANAGLRTACLVGAWAKFAKNPPPGQKLKLSAGDLDEAIADLLLPNSLISADGNGVRPPSGFQRVEALRKGYLEGSPVCSTQFG